MSMQKKGTLFIFVQTDCRSTNEDCLQPFMGLHLLVWDSKHMCSLTFTSNKPKRGQGAKFSEMA